jgi:hypothetical protein
MMEPQCHRHPDADQGCGELSIPGRAVRRCIGSGALPEHGRQVMRVLVIVKASEESEAGGMPDAKELAEMGKFNEKLVEAGVMLMADGLHPSSKGARVRFEGKTRTVIDGPFAEAKELVAGFWLWQVRSMDEAIEWIKRAPLFDGGVEIELRPVMDMGDFGDAATPEIREHEANLRGKIAKA